ncbi:MAG: ATP-binding protein [Lentisphaeria bacterium]|nr:ATP-binding protein [Lentisphaeria bacterium]
MKKLFVFGRPVSGDEFTDRQEETARLLKNFTYGINTFIISPRRLGKTSLVKKVQALSETPERLVVYLDLFQCRSREEFCQKFASTILTQVGGSLEKCLHYVRSIFENLTLGIKISATGTGEIHADLDISQHPALLEKVLQLPEEIARRRNIDIVICLDEFQEIASFTDSLAFQKTLRSIWQQQEHTSYCLFGSRYHLMEELLDKPSKPFYKFGDVIYLKTIPEEYWISFICDKFQSCGITIPKELALKICHSVSNHSSYVQQLSWLIYCETEGNVVTEENFRSALDVLLEQNNDLFEAQIDGLSALQRNLLSAVAHGLNDHLNYTENLKKYHLGSAAAVNAARKSLITKGFLLFTNSKLQLSDPVLGLWLLKKMG